MSDQRDVQQLIQSLTPSAVNNGNPNTVYNQPRPQGGYVPPTYNSSTNTFFVNPQAPSNIPDWKAMAMAQPQGGSWNPAPRPAPIQAPPLGGPNPPIPTTPVAMPPPPFVTGPGDGGPRPFNRIGSGEGCVVVDSVLVDYDRADDVQFGDTMFVIDPVTFKQSTGEVSYSETKLVPCVRITTESGIELECSRTAPIANEKGEEVLAPDLLNQLIPVSDNGMFYLDRVQSIEDIGEKEVRHITVENNFFLAGKQKGRYIFHHNMKMVDGTGMDFLAMRNARDSQFGWGADSGGFGAESMGRAGNFRPQQAAAWNGDMTGGPSAAWNGAMVDPNAQVANPFNQGLPNQAGMQDMFAYQRSLAMPSMSPTAQQAPAGGGLTGWIANTANWFDNNILGDLINENTNSVNWGNVGYGAAGLVTGIPPSQLRKLTQE